MLLNEHSALWNNIREFPLNEPGAAITFSHKLQEQQKWSALYTERVIEEYRKFILLCCVAPKGASPSKAVDEAWHLHLTYTKSYWIDLCKNTLGRDIHHHPSKGGEAENHKHADWYTETLDLYKQVFGREAPGDIWPPPYEEMDIPKPQFRYSDQTKITVVVILLMPFLFIAIFYGHGWPFNLTGPEFLWFFPLFSISILGVRYMIEKKKENFYADLVVKHFDKGATVFQQAKFLYGKHRGIQTALIDLLRRGLIEVRGDRVFIINNKNFYKKDNEENPLIDHFMKEPDQSELRYEEIDLKWYNEENFSHPSLTRLYRFAYRKKSIVNRYFINLIIVVVGGLRIVQGWMNGRPTGFLIVEIILLVVLALIVQRKFSRIGAIFSRARQIFYRKSVEKKLYGDEVVNDFASRGNDAIQWFSEGVILASIFGAFGPVNFMDHAGSSGSDWSSGDSSGGGGCSSCGGASCGGGGCGGCGGGGD